LTNSYLFFCRHCLWIIGEANNLIESGGTWKLLVNDAIERHIFGRLTSNKLSNVMKKLESNDRKSFAVITPASSGKIAQEVNLNISTRNYIGYFDCKVTFQLTRKYT
jgi:subtilisin-like proprotein convertase family protein